MLQRPRPPPLHPSPFLHQNVRVTAAVDSISYLLSPVTVAPPKPGGAPLRYENPERRPGNGFGRLWRGIARCSLRRAVADDESAGQSFAVLPASEMNVPSAVRAIRLGKVIAVPTDTIYGFACDACSAEAIREIYEIKGRETTKPLAVCVADVSDIPRFSVTEHLPPGLLDSLLPGPVTVILGRGESSRLDKSLNPGVASIGIRVPDCEFIRRVAQGSGGALALTSANLSGQPSSVRIHDFHNLWRRCAFVFDAGELPSGRAGSTVVDLTAPGEFAIKRPGSAREETVEVLRRFSLTES